jgi:hypothetical protein
MRAPEEIVCYYQELREASLNIQAEFLLMHLSSEQARSLLGAEQNTNRRTLSCDRDSLIEEMRHAMKVAWKKVSHHGRSVGQHYQRMRARLWLLEDDELLSYVEERGQYRQHGAPVFKRICEQYGFPIPEGEDIERMAQGLPCHPRCEDGCVLD